MESLKKFLITSFAQMPCVEGMEQNKLILITAAGTICGAPVTSIDDTVDVANLFTSTAKQMASVYREENDISPDALLNDTDGYIPLKDVIIRNGNTNFTMPFLCVFLDQIIGISLGNLD